MWKDFFYYTKSERRGVIVLLVIMALLAVIRIALPYILKDEEDKPLPSGYVEKLQQLEQKMSLATEDRPIRGKINPLQLDSSGFVKVGFTAKEAHELIIMKRNSTTEEFYFKFMDYAINKNPEWVDHIDELRIRE